MDDHLQNLIDSRGLGISLSDGDPYSYILIARADVAIRIPAPWPRGTIRQDPVGLLYAALITNQFYDECDDVLDWCGEHKLDPADSRVLDGFRALDADIHRLAALIGDAAFKDIRLRIARGQAIAKAANPAR